MNVHIQQTHFPAGTGQRIGKVGGHGAFAHAALAGHDNDFPLDLAEGLRKFEGFLTLTATGTIPGTVAGTAASAHNKISCVLASINVLVKYTSKNKKFNMPVPVRK